LKVEVEIEAFRLFCLLVHLSLNNVLTCGKKTCTSVVGFSNFWFKTKFAGIHSEQLQ